MQMNHKTATEDNVCDPGKMDVVEKNSGAISSNTSHHDAKVKRSGSSLCEPLSFDPNSRFDSAAAAHKEATAGPVGTYPCPLPTPRGHMNADHQSGRNGSHAMSPNTKTTGNAKASTSNVNQGWGSSSSSRSDSLDSTSAPIKPHTGGDVRWDAINSASSRDSPLGLSNFRLLKRLGYGDIGSVYLVELRGTSAFFAMKVMDKASLASRNKLLRAQTEREILGLLDHPFLPTLYSYFETEKFYCLVMEFCSGGNLHSLRQKQPNKHFTEEAARSLLLLPLLFMIYRYSLQ